MTTHTLNSKQILGACVGDCIHVAGILNFFQLAENTGYKTRFLGPAVKIDRLIPEIKNSNAGIIALSYRLTPENGERFLTAFIDEVKNEGLHEGRRFVLGALPVLADRAREWGFFEAVFAGGETIDEVMPLLRQGVTKKAEDFTYPDTLVERVEFKAPFPVLRAHFGLPSLEETLDGIEEIARAGVLDVISIAPDQAAQECFHRPDELACMPEGSGGVPVRCKEHLEAMHARSRLGNHPLLRIYSGTRDLLKNAGLFHETIKNAWAAIPLFWYSELDGRGPCKLEDAIAEHIEAIKWHADRDIPVEINDPHQWGLRMAPDHVVVADAFLCAKAAKELGVKTYVEQLMFNTPSGNTLAMDLARVLAMIEIVQPLVDDGFSVLKQTRAGLSYLSPRLNVAKGQLCASTMMQMAVKPHVMHVVTYCEGDHAARPAEIIESCQLVGRVIQDAYYGLPIDMLNSKDIQDRKNELLEEATVLLKCFMEIGEREGIENPFVSTRALSQAVWSGLLDASQLIENPAAKGEIKTMIERGKCIVVDGNNLPLPERERVAKLGFNVDLIDARPANLLFTKA